MVEYTILNTMWLLQFLSTLLMTGLIWFVQIVHYPLFAHVGQADFTDYERQHRWRTTAVVAPVMLLELISAVACIYWSLDAASGPAWLGLLLLFLIWLSTLFLQVPAHDQLTKQYSHQVVRRLVLTNWIRTLAWTGRSLILLSELQQRWPTQSGT